MIRVEVEGYCHSCLDFQPEVIKPQRMAINDKAIVTGWTDTIIQCENHKRCSNIKRYLEQQTKEEACG